MELAGALIGKKRRADRPVRISSLTRTLPLALLGMILLVEIVGTASSISEQGAEEFAARADLRSFLTAADIVAAERADRLYDLETQLEWQRRRFPIVHDPSALLLFANPPFVAFALQPFAPLSTPTAYWIAFGLNGVAFVAALALLGLLLRSTQPPARMILVVGAASFLPMWTALWQGQLSLILYLGVLGSGLAFRGGRDFLAGLSLSVLLCKPHLLLVPLLFLLLQRRHRAVLGVALGAGFAALLSLATVGTEGLAAWWALGGELMNVGDLYGIHPRRMYTLRSLFHLVLQSDGLARVALPWGIASLLVLAASGWLWRKPLVGSRFSLALGVSVVVGLVIGPHGYTHDLVLAAPASLALAAAAIQDWPRRRAGWSLATVAFVWVAPWVAGDFLPAPAVVPVLLALPALAMWRSYVRFPEPGDTAPSSTPPAPCFREEVTEILRPAPCSMVRGDEDV